MLLQGHLRDPEHCYEVAMPILGFTNVRALNVDYWVEAVDRRDSKLAYPSQGVESGDETGPDGCIKGVLGI